MASQMDWDELRREVDALREDHEATAVELAAQGARLLHRALTEMYIGEPEPLREIALTIAEARPEVVAMRNVGVSAYRTAREARAGDRMAAAARSVARLARLLDDTPAALGRRAQPLIPDSATMTTLGDSVSVRAAIIQAADRMSYFDFRSIWEPDPDEERLARSNGAVPPPLFPAADLSESIEAALDGCDIVLLGCTAFLADGTMAADPGTLQLVEAAAEHDPPIPVHFFADTLKLAPWLPEAPDGHTMPPLDIIPPQYVDHVITEDGIRRPPQLLQAAADLAGWWRMLETPDG